MTFLVGLVDKGDVYIGADSGVFDKEAVEISVEPKVFRNGEFLMASAGTMRFVQMLRYAFQPPPIADFTNLSAYMNTVFATQLRECARANGYLKKEEDQEKLEDELLVGVRGHLFEVDCILAAFERLEPYNALGCGADTALAILYATDHSDLDPEGRLTLAWQAVEHFTLHVKAPFTIERLPTHAWGD